MLIKLHYTAQQDPTTAWRLLAWIINNSGITSIATLVSSLSANSAWAGLTTSLDQTNSYIIRTDAASNTIAHMSRPSLAASTYPYSIVIRQPIHDSPGHYVYTRIYNGSTTANTGIEHFGSAISGGSMSDSQWAISASNAQSTSQGTTLTMSGTTSGARSGAVVNSTTTGFYTFWCYITDYSIIHAFNYSFTTALGISTSDYGTSTGWYGPSVISQYKRFDYWNNPTNNIYPLMYFNTNRTSGNLFYIGNEWAVIENPQSATAANCQFSVLNIVTTGLPSLSTSWTISADKRVSFGIGNRYSDCYPLNASSTGALVSSAYFGKVLDTANSLARMPTANLQNRGYTVLPVTFRAGIYNSMGGNASEIGDWYIFNGDYYPGDEFTLNSRTYIILPPSVSWTNRIGLAIPKE